MVSGLQANMADRMNGNAGKRTTALLTLAALALAPSGTSAVFAQDNQPIPPTSEPAPSPTSTRPIGGFQLPPADDGRAPGVQGPSDNGLPPASPNSRRITPTPSPTTPPRLTQPSVRPDPAPSTSRSAAPTTAPARAQNTSPPVESAPARPASGDSANPVAIVPAPAPAASASDSLPHTTNPLAAPPSDINDDNSAPTPAPTESPSFGWLWILAAILLVAGGLLFWRKRRGALVDGQAKPALSPQLRAPAPSPSPKPAQPAAAQPAAANPSQAAARALGVDPDHRAPSPLVTRPTNERRALLSLSLEVLRINVTATNIAVNFVLTIRNQGSADAVGVLTRLALQQGSAMPEAVLNLFYDGAGGSVLRDDISIAVGASEVLTTEVNLPRGGIEPIQIGGKPMLVPVLALDVTYHWDGPADAFGQIAQAFVLGRMPASGSDRLGPLRLDQEAYIVQPGGVHATTMQRSQ